MKKLIIKIFVLVFFSMCSLCVILMYNGVSKEITKDDLKFTKKILNNTDLKSLAKNNFYDELKLIKLVQTTVLEVAPKNKGIPHNEGREPKNLYEYQEGLCFDRSRVIEKMFNILGFETRHISIFKSGKSSVIPLFLKSGTPSHAISEVLTSKGWMFVDSNDKFLGLTINNDVISVSLLNEIGFDNFDWNAYNNKDYKVIYKYDFSYIYGLYSRHGHFYPPYNFVPDINLCEFSGNF